MALAKAGEALFLKFFSSCLFSIFFRGIFRFQCFFGSTLLRPFRSCASERCRILALVSLCRFLFNREILIFFKKVFRI